MADSYKCDRLPLKVLKKIRSFPESGIREFGTWIQSESFKSVIEAETATDKVDAFEKIIAKKIDDIFPFKEVRIYKGDKEFMTKQLRQLRRQKSREYRRNKKSVKFLKLHDEYIKAKQANTKE